jgi:hypothetical protein
MSYTTTECRGHMDCPICGSPATRWVHVGVNLSEEERDEFQEFTECRCPVDGEFELN